MKRWLCALLAIVMVLSLVACGGNTAQSGGTTTAPAGDNETKDPPKEPGQLKVGYGRADITPAESVPLGGYGNSSSRLSNDVIDALMATCVVMEEGDNKLMMFSVDNIRSREDLLDEARNRIHGETGFPKENIMFCATHSHSTPELNEEDNSAIKAYMDVYYGGMVAAAKEALADLTASHMEVAITETEKLNFIRHYICNDGTYVGSNFGTTASGIKDYAAPTDPNMQLVKIVREGEKKEILIMNYQAHPCQSGGVDKKVVSADFIGPCRAKIERETDMLFMFLQGAAGNQAATTSITADDHGLDNTGYGEAVAQYAIDALPTMKKLDGTAVKLVKTDFTFNHNHADIDKLEDAKKVVALWQSSGDRNKGNALAVELGFTSVYHANAVISRVEFPEKATFSMYAARIGNLGIVYAPYEMFAAQGMMLKAESPFGMTVVATCANNAQGYFPTIEAYEYGCYESYTCVYEKGIAEAAANALLDMLKELHKDPAGTAQDMQGGIHSDLTNESAGNWTDTAALPAQGNWKLDADVVLTQQVTVRKGYELTIDLNGHNISRKLTEEERLDQSLFRVVGGGKLTIKDSAGDKGKLTVTYDSKATQRTGGVIIYVEPGAEALIEGGNFDLSARTTKYSDAGGLVYTGGKLTISGGKFAGYKNTAAGDGTVLAGGSKSEILITGGSFTGGGTGGSGGAIYTEGAMTIKDGTFVGGVTTGSGGIIYTSGQLTIEGGQFSVGIKSGNAATDGGLIRAAKGALNISGGTFQGAPVSGNGSCIYANGAVSISGGTFQGNKAASGGVIYAANALTITGGTFQGVAGGTAKGGLIAATGTRLSIEGGTFQSNGNNKDGYSIFYEKSNGVLIIKGNATLDGGICIVSTNKRQPVKLQLYAGAVIDSSKAAASSKYDLKLRNVKVYIDGKDTGIVAPEAAAGQIYDVQYSGTTITGVK